MPRQLPRLERPEGGAMEYITDEAFGWLMSLILATASFVAWLIDLFHEEK
jgi:hypothetical protein